MAVEWQGQQIMVWIAWVVERTLFLVRFLQHFLHTFRPHCLFATYFAFVASQCAANSSGHHPAPRLTSLDVTHGIGLGLDARHHAHGRYHVAHFPCQVCRIQAETCPDPACAASRTASLCRLPRCQSPGSRLSPRCGYPRWRASWPVPFLVRNLSALTSNHLTIPQVGKCSLPAIASTSRMTVWCMYYTTRGSARRNAVSLWRGIFVSPILVAMAWLFLQHLAVGTHSGRQATWLK